MYTQRGAVPFNNIVNVDADQVGWQSQFLRQRRPAVTAGRRLGIAGRPGGFRRAARIEGVRVSQSWFQGFDDCLAVVVGNTSGMLDAWLRSTKSMRLNTEHSTSQISTDGARSSAFMGPSPPSSWRCYPTSKHLADRYRSDR